MGRNPPLPPVKRRDFVVSPAPPLRRGTPSYTPRVERTAYPKPESSSPFSLFGFLGLINIFGNDETMPIPDYPSYNPEASDES